MATDPWARLPATDCAEACSLTRQQLVREVTGRTEASRSPILLRDVALSVRRPGRRGIRAPHLAYDDRMKRITVSLPDDLVDKIKHAAGGEGQVSSYVATALADYQEQESLDELLVAWRDESPVPDEVRQQVEAELDDAGLRFPTHRSSRITG